MIHFQEYFLLDYIFMISLKVHLISLKLSHGKHHLLQDLKIRRWEFQFTNANVYHQPTQTVLLIQSWKFGLLKIKKFEPNNVMILTTRFSMKSKNLIWIFNRLTQLSQSYWIFLIGIKEWLKIHMISLEDPSYFYQILKSQTPYHMMTQSNIQLGTQLKEEWMMFMMKKTEFPQLSFVHFKC